MSLFYSCKPYLSVPLHRNQMIIAQFDSKCRCETHRTIETELLREYAEKHPTIVSEVTSPEELRKLYEAEEEKMIQGAEERERIRQYKKDHPSDEEVKAEMFKVLSPF